MVTLPDFVPVPSSGTRHLAHSRQVESFLVDVAAAINTGDYGPTYVGAFADEASLPAEASDGEWALTEDNGHAWLRISGAWVDRGTGLASSSDVVTKVDADVTYSIPTDYTTLQDALDTLSARVPLQGVTVALNIETGHALTAGVLLEGGDYSRFTITSDDATVSLDAGFVGVSTLGMPSTISRTAGNLFVGFAAVMPNLACLVDMGGVGGDGLTVSNDGTARVSPGCGVINAGRYGAHVNSASLLHAPQAVFTGATEHGVIVTQASVASAQAADASGAGTHGFYCSRGSVLHCQDAVATDCGLTGVIARRSRINAQGVDVSRSAGVGIRSTVGSTVTAYGAVADDVVGNEFQVEEGSTLDISSATVGGAAATAAHANVSQLNANDYGNGIIWSATQTERSGLDAQLTNNFANGGSTDTAPADYPLGISYFLTDSSATGWPGNGTVTTVNLGDSSRTYQTIMIISTPPAMQLRRWTGADWTAWVALT